MPARAETERKANVYRQGRPVSADITGDEDRSVVRVVDHAIGDDTVLSLVEPDPGGVVWKFIDPKGDAQAEGHHEQAQPDRRYA
jgi:hypothetical protein